MRWLVGLVEFDLWSECLDLGYDRSNFHCDHIGLSVFSKKGSNYEGIYKNVFRLIGGHGDGLFRRVYFNGDFRWRRFDVSDS